MGDSGVKARPKKERREVELYTKTAVWGEVKSSNHLQLPTTFQRERRREFTRQGIKAPNNMETKKPRVKQVMMRVPVVPRRSEWDDLIFISFECPEKFLKNHCALPRRSGWEISDTKIGAETKLLPALCPVANLFSESFFIGPR